MPECIDFCAHILRQLERYCRLVSRSGVIRVNVGAEIKKCEPQQAAMEAMIAQQKLPSQWQKGRGFIVRFFLSEVRPETQLQRGPLFSLRFWTLSFSRLTVYACFCASIVRCAAVCRSTI